MKVTSKRDDPQASQELFAHRRQSAVGLPSLKSQGEKKKDVIITCSIVWYISTYIFDSGMLYILWYVYTYGETFIPKTRFHGDLEEVSSEIPPFPGKGEVSYP